MTDGSSESKLTRCLDDLRGAVAAWVLGLLESHVLPQVAARALAENLDNIWLRELAGLSSPRADGANELLKRALDAANVNIPDKRTAALHYAQSMSRLIGSGRVTPYVGAQAIWRASIAVGDPSFHELDAFIYAASEYEDRPADRNVFDAMIVREAGNWANR
jgi:hypothetical protein